MLSCPLWCCLLVFGSVLAGLAQGPTHGAWGDQGDGTYANPIMPGDFSDLDAIRVGDQFYAITSAFTYSPGIAILRSKDLVSWEIVGHAVSDLTSIDPELNWDRMGRRGRGIWAGSIRFHAGRFWIYFGTPDQGIFMTTAADVLGPWTTPKLVLAATGWDDPCPFWDDDGQGYLVATHFAAEPPSGITYNIHLFQMNAVGEDLVAGSDRVIHRSEGSEANKLYKIHGLYFHYYSEVKPEGRVVMMERAKSLAGPWEIRQLNHVNAKVDKEPNQGGLIELPSGKWWFVTHQGRGDWEGRAGVLLPVTWIDGWPILGKPGADGIGNMVWRGEKPFPSAGRSALVASDTFDGPQLLPQWEWNYQPRAAMWSLTERPGFLRMHAFPALGDGGFRSVGNVLTQRAMRTPESTVTARMELAGMEDGTEAGLAHYAKTFCTLSVRQAGRERGLWFHNSAGATAGPVAVGGAVWLRSTWGFDGLSRFSYSTDGVRFQPLGSACPLTWADYRGDRVGVFATGKGGFVDVDSFAYEVKH